MPKSGCIGTLTTRRNCRVEWVTVLRGAHALGVHVFAVACSNTVKGLSEMARKTIAVQELKDHVNGMLKDSAPEMVESRTALGVLLSSVLMDTGNYAGFNYLPSEFVDVGVRRVLREGYDKTRVFYY